jgi:hypothetical protein
LKKVLSALALLGALSVGGVLVYSNIEEAGSETSSKIANTATGLTHEQEEVKELPTERTVDVQGNPWEYLETEKMVSEVQNGGQVFLFSDAESIEKTLSVFAAYEYPETQEFTQGEGENFTKEKAASSWSVTLQAYINDLKEFYPDKVEYFTKLDEVVQSLDSADYEGVATKIEEAKQLRTQE